MEGTRVLCHAHVRRKFADIVKGQKGNGSVEVAKEVIKKYKAIFKTDSEIRKECGNEYILIREKREAAIRPKLDDLFTYLDEIIEQVSEKSELYKAIQYARTNKVQLYTFLEDGRLELTNNLSERSQKPVIIGRKNCMFLGSARGAQSSAIILALPTIRCSLVESAKENRLIPRRYLNYLLDELPKMEEDRNYELERLMPWHQDVQKSCKAKEADI